MPSLSCPAQSFLIWWTRQRMSSSYLLQQLLYFTWQEANNQNWTGKQQVFGFQPVGEIVTIRNLARFSEADNMGFETWHQIILKFCFKYRGEKRTLEDVNISKHFAPLRFCRNTLFTRVILVVMVFHFFPKIRFIRVRVLAANTGWLYFLCQHISAWSTRRISLNTCIPQGWFSLR